MERKIGPYKLIEEKNIISIYDTRNDSILEESNEIYKKIISDYKKQKENPDKYFDKDWGDNCIKKSVYDENIEYLFIPDGKYGLFENVGINSVKYVSLPDGLDVIYDAAFCCWENLKEIEIPDTVTSIYEEVFLGCSSLEKIKLPNNNNLPRKLFEFDKIDDGAFFRCTSLKEIIIPDTVTKIAYGAFENCKNLEKVVLPENLEVISERAFSGCEKLKEINLPKSLKEVDESAFLNCKELENTDFMKNIKLLNN